MKCETAFDCSRGPSHRLDSLGHNCVSVDRGINYEETLTQNAFVVGRGGDVAHEVQTCLVVSDVEVVVGRNHDRLACRVPHQLSIVVAVTTGQPLTRVGYSRGVNRWVKNSRFRSALPLVFSPRVMSWSINWKTICLLTEIIKWWQIPDRIARTAQIGWGRPTRRGLSAVVTLSEYQKKGLPNWKRVRTHMTWKESGVGQFRAIDWAPELVDAVRIVLR